MSELAAAIDHYVKETKRLRAIETSNEPTFYPLVANLLAAILKHGRLPFEARTGTSEGGPDGRAQPDFVLGDAGLFVAVFGEVKLPEEELPDIAASVERNNQIGRYLTQTGVVLICNVRAFGLLVVRAGYERKRGVPVPPEERELLSTVDLWEPDPLRPQTLERLVEVVERSVTDYAPIADPADLAKILARQARDAKEAVPADLRPLAPLLDDFRQALGLSFDIGDEKGDRFFRSSLVQTAFYSLFAAWILWDRTKDAAAFDIGKAQAHLRIPFLEQLFYDLQHPRYLQHLDLGRHLERAVATLNRVDRGLFRGRMTFPIVGDESPTVAAITYFYEPFLDAFDPELREELGVWYTPPEIVRYQVGRVHHILKAELGRPRGLADPDVVILDPCCGTGAYLLEVARCIAIELRAEGDLDMLGVELLKAFEERVIGFEILTAPFAIAQLQLYIVLAELEAPPPPGQRLAIYLTNALTGWRDQADVKIRFPEMQDEFDASQAVKHSAKIIVVLGNPPYDRFAGAAQAEEAELVAHYKGVDLVEERTKDDEVKHDEFGRPKKKQRGQSLLYKEFGVRKQLLDDLYIRFLRLAEERIGEAADLGIVSFISNSSYLTGRSHPLMRRSLLTNFQKVWIDNLNGDKFKTGKLIPRGLPGEGTSDQSAFTTDMDPRGIQPGTAIVTWLKRPVPRTAPDRTEVLYRDFWGLAKWKRQGLLSSLPTGDPPPGSAVPAYAELSPSTANRWRLSPHSQEAGYESWPGLDELFPVAFQGVNHNRGLEDTVIDTKRDRLSQRMRAYIEAPDFSMAVSRAPELGEEYAGYSPETVWLQLRSTGYLDSKLLPFLTY